MKLFWAALLAAHAAWGQTPALYQNADAPLEKRVDDLLSRMTVAEKVSQTMNDSPAIDHLGIPAYNWWNECLHGVARAGRATVFPEASPALRKPCASQLRASLPPPQRTQNRPLPQIHRRNHHRPDSFTGVQMT